MKLAASCRLSFFENDTQKALDLLAGQDLETHSMGLAQAYDLGAAVEDLALEVQGLPRNS